MIRAKLRFAFLHAVQADSLTIIPHPLAFVKRFFKSFLKNFCGVFCFPLVVSLPIIALLFLFVKHFWTSFCGLESSAVCHKNVVAFLCNFANTSPAWCFLLPTHPPYPLRICTYIIMKEMKKSARRFPSDSCLGWGIRSRGC